MIVEIRLFAAVGCIEPYSYRKKVSVILPVLLQSQLLALCGLLGKTKTFPAVFIILCAKTIGVFENF